MTQLDLVGLFVRAAKPCWTHEDALGPAWTQMDPVGTHCTFCILFHNVMPAEMSFVSSLKYVWFSCLYLHQAHPHSKVWCCGCNRDIFSPGLCHQWFTIIRWNHKCTKTQHIHNLNQANLLHWKTFIICQQNFSTRLLKVTPYVMDG